MRATNVLLNDEEHKLLNEFTTKEGISKGEIIRRAIRYYCTRDQFVAENEKPLAVPAPAPLPQDQLSAADIEQASNPEVLVEPSPPSLPLTPGIRFNETTHLYESEKTSPPEKPEPESEKESYTEVADRIARHGWTDELMKKIFGKIF